MSRKGISLFIVSGRTGHSLIVCKALPFVELEAVEDIVIFSEDEGFKIPKCRYITMPVWIRKIRPSFIKNFVRMIAEPLQLIYFSLLLKPDLINGIYCMPKGINSLIASKLIRTKSLISVIGSRLEVETEFPLRKIWEGINIWLLKKCDAISIKGKTDFDYLISKKINPQKMFPLNGAIDTDKFGFAYGERPIDLLFVGTFYELKGPDRFLKVVHRLLINFPDLNVVMVGNGVLWEKSKVMAVELGLIQKVLFEGFQKNVVPYFQKSKILVMPSRSDSLPTSMLEAMSCGCVPVVSDVGNIREAAEHNVNAKIIKNFEDINSYVTCITELLNNAHALNEFAIKARNKVENAYSIKKQSLIAQKVINYLMLNKEIFKSLNPRNGKNRISF